MNQNTLLINKYTPLFFKDFEIDASLINLLNTFISINTLNILFIGDIGSGKTSLLSAAIREYYSYNYTTPISNKLIDDNVLYINSLKDQGINYYRTDVKTFCQTCSSIKNKKKIVVLDDLDLINEQSQQVFRNCIDKFGHSVHFIASCSNIQKVIESIQSRFNIIKIKPLERVNLTKILRRITALENITINPDAEDFILDLCNNTIKILINYIEKFKLLNEEITLSLATSICTNISFITFKNYTELLKSKQLMSAIKLLYSVHEKGYSVMDILDNYFLFIKTTNMISEDDKYKIIPYICKYITIFHNIHEDDIELALFTNNLINIL